jgi:DNA-binding NarL/FixJ family response regulator
MKKDIELIIVDDHKMFRDGLKHLLNCIGNIKVIAEASTGEEFLELLDKHSPDLVLIDISMPGISGVTATENAIAKHPGLKIIALSMFGSEEHYNSMICAGVKGFVLKESGSEELENAISEVINGNTYFSKELLKTIIDNLDNKPFSNGNQIKNKEVELSKREKEVLNYISQGMNNPEIARILHLSQRTVEGHRANLLKKTSTKNTVNLIMFAIKNKLVDIR